MRAVSGSLALLLLAGAACAEENPAQDKPLVIPQVEGARQGRVIGRALACGIARERADALVRANRERMLAAVGRAFTQDRYLPALGEAIAFETSLPRPAEPACAKALADFESLEAVR